MIRHKNDEPLAAEHPGATDPQHTPRVPRRWLAVTVVTALLLAAAVTYLLTLAPDHYAASQAERLNGDTRVDVSSVVQVEPGAGWVVKPRVTNLLEWSPLPPVRDWRVLTGAETGVELLSPDRGLSVQLVAEPARDGAGDGDDGDDGADGADGADGGDAGEAGADAGASWLSGAGGAGDVAVLVETLASGAQLQHTDAAGEVRAVVALDGQQVRVLARATGHQGAASDEIAAYRPTLSALLESLRAV